MSHFPPCFLVAQTPHLLAFNRPKSFITSIFITQVTCSVIFPSLISSPFLFSIPFHRAKYSQITFSLAFHHPYHLFPPFHRPNNLFSHFSITQIFITPLFSFPIPSTEQNIPTAPEILQFNTVNSPLDGITLIHLGAVFS